MSSGKNKRIRKGDAAEPDDVATTWPQRELIAMDERFRAAVLQALRQANKGS